MVVPGLLACLALRFDASRATDMRARAAAAAEALQRAVGALGVRLSIFPAWHTCCMAGLMAGYFSRWARLYAALLSGCKQASLHVTPVLYTANRAALAAVLFHPAMMGVEHRVV